MIFSYIFSMLDKRESGRKFETFFLNTGITSDILSTLGNTPVMKDQFIRLERGLEILSWSNFRIFIGILFVPEDTEEERPPIILATSSDDEGLSKIEFWFLFFRKEDKCW